MLDITAETKKVREDMEKQGYVLTEEEYQIILEYTIRKSDRCGKGRDYVPLLLEDEIKNYYFRNTVTAISLINMAVQRVGKLILQQIRSTCAWFIHWQSLHLQTMSLHSWILRLLDLRVSGNTSRNPSRTYSYFRIRLMQSHSTLQNTHNLNHVCYGREPEMALFP